MGQKGPRRHLLEGSLLPPPHTKMLAARRLAASASPLLRRRLSAQPQPGPPPPPADEGAGAWARRAAALSLLGLTGAVAASAVSDLSVFLSCSRSSKPTLNLSSLAVSLRAHVWISVYTSSCVDGMGSASYEFVHLFLICICS